MTLNITALWDALGWAILHSLWQGAVIGFLVWAVRTLATDRHAWLRYLAGMAGLVSTFVAFLATFMILTFNRAQSWVPVEFSSGPDAEAAKELTLSISVLPMPLGQAALSEALVPWLGMGWAVGFAFLSLQAYRAYATTRWLATRGLHAPDADWTTRFTALIKRSRTHERVRLFVSDHVSGPMTLGALRPIVLVPVGFLTALPPAQIEAILLHELAHIRRHDFLFGLIQTAIRTVLYFNPAVIMISRQIDEDREEACDDIAVTVSGSPSDLVRGLAALRLGSNAPAMAMAADGGPLLTRLNRLMGRPASRSTSSRLTAAAVSALLLGTAACSTVSMAHPHPPAIPVAPEASIPDTIVRAKPEGQSRIYAANATSLPPLPVMPVMPAVPATPELPAVPMPVFGDYDSKDAFEAAMESWGEQMEVWGEEVERRFEGDWEDKMEAWGEEMEVWGEQFGEQAAHFDISELAELSQLADLSELAKLGDLSELKPGIYIDGDAVDAKGDVIKARVLLQVEARLRAQDEQERAMDRAERAQGEAERAEDRAERARDRAEQQADRAQERAERLAERQAERAHEMATQHETRSSSHSKHTVTVNSDEPGNTVIINGRKLDVDSFRTKVMNALIEDGFIRAGDRSVTLALCGDSLEVDGKTGSKAQAKRYAKMLKSAGLDLDNSIVLKLKPDLMSLSMSGPGDEKDREISVGTYEHTPNK
ncbi:hypothetical protein GCM10009069_24860 [Algimonas arctica]|uniref:Peptidase M56 domain-containing protein n=1 Tax=Algimonas arctica TaxID=1479486 RepID=A0A8J3G373_9PROT|nr:M56 family metallopeptidase [Algimonas arctica]GHB00957.1 hypothetical protein GCM10009069_24860 [Algimonas arctica]